MKTNHLSSILISLFLFLFLQTGVYATSYAVGVKEEDWVKYGDVVCNWYGDVDERPQGVIDLQNTQWIEMTVKKVVESNVTILMTKHFKNGSTSTRTFSGNVETGDGDLQGQVIAKDLHQGDNVYNSAKSPEIGATKLRRYSGASRYVNNANFTIGYQEYKLFWDKETGILCEQMIMFVYETLTGLRIPYLFLMRVTETTAWESETDGPGETWLLGVIILLLVAILVIMRLKGVL